MNEKKNLQPKKIAPSIYRAKLWETGLLPVSRISTKSPVSYRDLLDAGDYEKLETLLIEHLDADPADIDFFLPAYRAFVKKQQTDRALAILQLHADCLKTREDALAEISLFRHVLEFWPECLLARDVIISHLRIVYARSPHFDQLVKQLKALEPGADLATLQKLESWLRYDTGQAVYMQQKGVGRIIDVNFILGVVRAQFEGKEQISLKIDEAQRLLQSLPKEHFLSRKLDDPDALKSIGADDPGELLRLLFTSMKRPIAPAELREILGGIIAENAWSAWWSKAKKDKRLVIGSAAKAPLTWNESAAHAEGAIESRFALATAYEKLDMLEQYSARSADLAAVMLQSIVADAQAALGPSPALALEIALTLEKISAASETVMPFSVDALLMRVDAVDIMTGIKDRLMRRKAIQRACALRGDWQELCTKFLRTETDSQTLSFMYAMLKEKADEDVFKGIVSHTFSDPGDAPRFYVWLCEELPTRPELKEFADLPFLQTLLRNLDNSIFRGLHAQLRKLFDLGEAADYAIASLDNDECGRLLESLTRDGALEDYRKERIRQEIFLRFPLLHEKKEHVFYVTAEALEKKRVEFEQLIKVDLPRNSLEIQRTREYGDLRENFEYHAARARQEMLSSRAKTLHDQLGFSRAIDFEIVDASKISIGTKVTLKGIDNKEDLMELSVLGPWDSDPAKNILSYTSAAGAVLLNSPLGAEVVYSEKKYVVEKIEVWKKEE
jgi:transcription elongation factor GreA